MEMSPLKILRKRLDISQAELGSNLGITGQRIWQVENGDGALSRRNLLLLFDLYGPDLEKLALTHEDFLRNAQEDSAA